MPRNCAPWRPGRRRPARALGEPGGVERLSGGLGAPDQKRSASGFRRAACKARRNKHTSERDGMAKGPLSMASFLSARNDARYCRDRLHGWVGPDLSRKVHGGFQPTRKQGRQPTSANRHIIRSPCDSLPQTSGLLILCSLAPGQKAPTTHALPGSERKRRSVTALFVVTGTGYGATSQVGGNRHPHYQRQSWHSLNDGEQCPGLTKYPESTCPT